MDHTSDPASCTRTRSTNDFRFPHAPEGKGPREEIAPRDFRYVDELDCGTLVRLLDPSGWMLYSLRPYDNQVLCHYPIGWRL